jgi:hypothetical protein
VDLRPALWAVVAGVALAFGTSWVLQALGPAEWQEATVVARDSSKPASEVQYHLVLETASGESFDAWGTDKKLAFRPGEAVRVEISDFGHVVQTVERHGRGASPESGGDLAFWMALTGGGFLVGAVGACADAKRRIRAVATAVAGLGTGALPVLLLF